jgi:hypothetical protein
MPTLTSIANGVVPIASDFNGNFQLLSNAIGSATAITSWTQGDLAYASAANTLSKLAIGNTSTVLTLSNGLPAWLPTVGGLWTASGAWTTPAYSAGNFTAGSATWTVDSGDVTTYAYIQNGKTMLLAFELVNTSISGGPAGALSIKIPNSATIHRVTRCRIVVKDNGAAPEIGAAFIQSINGNTVDIYKGTAGGAATFANSTNATDVTGQILFETN